MKYTIIASQPKETLKRNGINNYINMKMFYSSTKYFYYNIGIRNTFVNNR